MRAVAADADLDSKAAEVAEVLRAIANERRLLVLCRLVEMGEANVNSLAEAVGLSQSALSQHLSKMRHEGLIAYRRDGQTLWYKIADPRIEELLATLHALYCRPQKKMPKRQRRA